MTPSPFAQPGPRRQPVVAPHPPLAAAGVAHAPEPFARRSGAGGPLRSYLAAVIRDVRRPLATHLEFVDRTIPALSHQSVSDTAAVGGTVPRHPITQ
jgi:hypothetical protein